MELAVGFRHGHKESRLAQEARSMMKSTVTTTLSTAALVVMLIPAASNPVRKLKA